MVGAELIHIMKMVVMKKNINKKGIDNMDKDIITLEIYGTYEENGDIQREKWFDVPRDWLEVQVLDEYDTLEEFLNDYTWDNTEFLYARALEDGVVTNEREV